MRQIGEMIAAVIHEPESDEVKNTGPYGSRGDHGKIPNVSKPS